MTPARFDFTPLLRAVLTRLVRIAIGCGFSYQSFAKLLRTVYFDVAATFEPVKGKPNSDSRISLLTGLPRREVRSLREHTQAPVAPRPSLERLVMDKWSSDPDLIDEGGNMVALHRTVRQGGSRSFEALVDSVTKDVRARSLLDEWLRKGHVFLDESDRVHIALRRPKLGMEDTTGAALVIGELACDLLSGFEKGCLLERPSAGFSYHVVYGHRLTSESAQLICVQAMREASELAYRINRLIVEREALDAKSPTASQRVSFGFGSYQANIHEDPGLLDTLPAQPPAAPAA